MRTLEHTPVWKTIERGRIAHPRLTVFAAAFLVRLLFGALFFGSVDIINSSNDTVALWAGRPVFDMPYFPTINALLWFAGALSSLWGLPLPLALKIGPILFDSLSAVLIYDLLSTQIPEIALRAGILYALNPLALLITSFHGQWDSIALFFLLLAISARDSNGTAALREASFGSLLAISLLIKPITLPFLALIPPRKGDGALWWPALAGLMFTFGAAFALFSVFGYSPIGALARIGLYSMTGVQVFGLPFAPGLARFGLLTHRLALVSPAMLVLALLYHRRRLPATDAMLLFYLVTIATVGLSPQYLLWPLPLLVLSGRFRMATVYTTINSVFLLLYYMNPAASYYPFENLTVFAPLRVFEWLLPPPLLTSAALLPVVHILGNVAIPVCAAALAVLLLKNALAQPPRSPETGRWTLRNTASYTLPAILLGLSIFAAKLAISNHELGSRLSAMWHSMPALYAMHVQSLEPTVILVADFAGLKPFNVIVLLTLLIVIWAGAALRDPPAPAPAEVPE